LEQARRRYEECREARNVHTCVNVLRVFVSFCGSFHASFPLPRVSCVPVPVFARRGSLPAKSFSRRARNFCRCPDLLSLPSRDEIPLWHSAVTARRAFQAKSAWHWQTDSSSCLVSSCALCLTLEHYSPDLGLLCERKIQVSEPRRHETVVRTVSDAATHCCHWELRMVWGQSVAVFEGKR